MTKATMLVFTSPTCPQCPMAKEFAHNVGKARDDVTIKHVVSGMPGSNGLFKKHDVMAVPTFIIKGPGYPSNIGLRGVQPEQTLHKYVDLALGKQLSEIEKKEKKGFFTKIKQVFAALEEE